MTKNRTLESPKESYVTPGGFAEDGSWNPAAHDDNALTTFVRELRRARRAGLEPADAASEVERRGFVRAFPNLAQWKRCHTWLETWASTSAESTVRLAFSSIVSGRSEPSTYPDPEWKPVNTEYGVFRAEVIQRILSESLTPREVGVILGDAMNLHPEIERREVDRLTAKGDRWGPV